jgi:hypothetical protein
MKRIVMKLDLQKIRLDNTTTNDTMRQAMAITSILGENQ